MKVIKKTTAKAVTSKPIYRKIFKKRVLAAQLALSITALPVMSNFSYAQGSGNTCTDPSVSGCTDLYGGTLAAIQSYNWQPASNYIGGLPAQWQMQSFEGGTLTASDMVIDVPTDQGTPTYTNLTSTMVFACPQSNGNTGTFQLKAIISNTTEISSTTEVMNSKAGFNSSSASVAIKYTTPKTPYGQASASASYTYNWGTSYETSQSTGGGKTIANGTESEYTFNVNYSVAPGYYQYLQINDNVSKFENDTWTSNITLSGDISNNVYTEKFVNTVKPSYANFAIPAGPDKGILANVWIPSKSWTSAKNDQMASPNGAFSFFPNSNNYLTSLYWTGVNTVQWGYSQGTSEYGSTGMNFDLNLPSGNNNNLIGYTSNNPSNVYWFTGPGIQYLGLLDVGYLTAYDANWNVIWTSAKYWTPPKANLYSMTATNATPSLVLPNNGQAFTATGTYSSTTYDSNATVGVTNPQPMSDDMINKYCNIYYSSNDNKVNGVETASQSKNYGFVNVQNAPGGNAKGHVEQIPPVRRDAIQNNIQNNPNIMNNGPRDGINNPQIRGAEAAGKSGPDGVIAGGAAPGRLDKPNELRKMKAVKIKSPLVLKPNQYYVANLPGFKVTEVVVHSKDLSSFTGFIGQKPQDLTLAESKVVKLRINEKTKYSVKKN